MLTVATILLGPKKYQKIARMYDRTGLSTKCIMGEKNGKEEYGDTNVLPHASREGSVFSVIR